MIRVADATNAADLRAILSAVLGASGDPATTSATLASVMRYIQTAAIEWRAWHDGTISDAVLALFIPGGVTSIMFSTPQNGTSASLVAAMDAVIGRRDFFVQAILDCDDPWRAAALTPYGFRRLATLAYLERSAVFPWLEPGGRLSWSDWTTAGADRFAAVVGATYVGSSDCPELAGARPVLSALESHRATGAFDPALWEIGSDACGEDVGCVLVTVDAHEAAAELTYLGVTPAHRGVGAGTELLARGVELGRRSGARRIRVAVDERNAAALRLYARNGFREFARREVWWRKGPVAALGVDNLCR